MGQKVATSAYERVNITLRRDTVGLLSRVTSKGTRSRFIDDAIRERVASLKRARLRKQLEAGYAARAARDLPMVEEWFAVDEDTWERVETRRRK